MGVVRSLMLDDQGIEALLSHLASMRHIPHTPYATRCGVQSELQFDVYHLILRLNPGLETISFPC